jgi:hypothetical protein
LFRSRTFAATNGVSFAMYVGVFGSIFLLAQFFQTTQGYTPLQADELGQRLRWAARKARTAGGVPRAGSKRCARPPGSVAFADARVVDAD